MGKKRLIISLQSFVWWQTHEPHMNEQNPLSLPGYKGFFAVIRSTRQDNQRYKHFVASETKKISGGVWSKDGISYRALGKQVRH